MAIKQVLVDDLDGSECDVTTFHLLGEGGEPLMIDLGPKNAEKYRKAMAPFCGAAGPDPSGYDSSPAPRTRAPRATGATKRASTGSGRSDVAQVRQWARENGHQVPDRGRLKPEIYADYDKAHGKG